VLTVDRATEADMGVISDLLVEIEEYYGGSYAGGDSAKIRDALFSRRPAATVLLAREGSQVLGFAAYTFMWPASGADTSLYLKELFVRENARRRGVAGALMSALRDVAHENGCTRLEWTADRDNPSALAFYEALGAKPREGKVFYRF
jgi:GNAT superfamily N-acetyltransferase